ncbi:MAG: hypothetical protein ABW252_10445 [Polyangiales bacterium]
MKFTAAFTRSELVDFASEWLPLKLLLGDVSKEDRYLALSEPRAIDLLPGKGLRLVCSAEIRWPLMGLTVPIKAHSLSVLLKPSIVVELGFPRLRFGIEIEKADLVSVPARIDAAITKAVNAALGERVKVGWDFGAMLTRSIAMPRMLATTESLDLRVVSHALAVTADALTLELGVHASASRRSSKRASEPPPPRR